MLSAILMGGNVLVKTRHGRRRDVPAHLRVPLDSAARLRDRVLDVRPAGRRPTACSAAPTVKGEHVLCVEPGRAPGRSRDDRSDSAVGAVRTRSTLVGRASKLLEPDAADAADGLGEPAQRLPRAVLARRRRRRAPGHGRWPGPSVATPSPDPTWGLHLLDANVELGNLVSIVDAQANNWLELTLRP